MPIPISPYEAPPPAAAKIGGMNANEDPRKTGTIIFVTRWKSSVPIPALIRATEGSSPVISGTRIVAPNMATMCWRPSTARRSLVSFHGSHSHRESAAHGAALWSVLRLLETSIDSNLANRSGTCVAKRSSRFGPSGHGTDRPYRRGPRSQAKGLLNAQEPRSAADRGSCSALVRQRWYVGDDHRPIGLSLLGRHTILRQEDVGVAVARTARLHSAECSAGCCAGSPAPRSAWRRSWAAGCRRSTRTTAGRSGTWRNTT